MAQINIEAMVIVQESDYSALIDCNVDHCVNGEGELELEFAIYSRTEGTEMQDQSLTIYGRNEIDALRRYCEMILAQNPDAK